MLWNINAIVSKELWKDAFSLDIFCGLSRIWEPDYRTAKGPMPAMSEISLASIYVDPSENGIESGHPSD